MTPPEDLEEALALLASEHGDQRLAVEWLAGPGLGHAGELIRLLREPGTPSLLRGRLLTALGAMRAAEAVPVLTGALRQGVLAWEAAQALAAVGTPEAETALIGSLADARPDVVREAVRGLGALGTPRATVALTRALDHPDPAIRDYAARALRG